MAKLYSRNQAVLKETAQQIKNLFIKKFRTQNALFCLIEDIKNPFLTKYRRGTLPTYSGQFNYEPIVEHLISEGILTKFKHTGNWNAIVDYTVNTLALDNFLRKAA